MVRFFKDNKDKYLNILYLLIILIIGVGVFEIKDKFSRPEYIAIAFAAFGIYCLSLYIIVKTVDHTKNRKLEETIETYEGKIQALESTWNDDLRNIIGLYQAKAESLESDWYYTMERLENYERTFEGKEIWVVSEHLDYEHSNECRFVPIIQNNLEKGIDYIYIVPNNLRLKTSVNHIKKIFTNKRPELKVIKKECFDYPSDILVFHDPRIQGKIKYIVFIELKVDKKYEKRGWAKIEKSFGETIVENIETDISANKIDLKDDNLLIEEYEK